MIRVPENADAFLKSCHNIGLEMEYSMIKKLEASLNDFLLVLLYLLVKIVCFNHNRSLKW